MFKQMFIDKASIEIKAGKGGNGAVSFHREKYVAAGGPDGGDGGKGGNVILTVDDHLSTLLDFRYKRRYEAQAGENGGSARCSGKGGQDLVIRVPRGTLIRDQESGLIIKDMSGDEPYVIAKGGNGGWGNSHFATPTRQAPRFAKNGLPGDELAVTLELKLLADVGLIGFPNVGKSTLLSVVSAARPKIANYHFTTLIPQLGVVKVDEGASFVMADIPGLIEGAGGGAGLGHEFLRHVDRCRLLVHLVDVAATEGRDPVEDFDIINRELKVFNPELAGRPQIVAGNKTDVDPDGETLRRFAQVMEERGYAFFPISAATRAGVPALMAEVARRLSELPPVKVFEPETVPPVKEKMDRSTDIRLEDGVYVVEGDWILTVLGGVNPDDYESLQYLQRVLRAAGVFDRLEEMGIRNGDTVDIYGFKFDYIP